MQLLQIAIETSEIQLTMLCIKVENSTRSHNTTMQHAIKSSEGKDGSLQRVSALKLKFKSIKPVIGDQKHES